MLTDLLDQVFQSTYQALILKDQGGAKAKITHDPVKATILTEESMPKVLALKLPKQDWQSTMVFQYRWRIVGEVNCWGHTHRRVNDYERFTSRKKQK